jgi:saccharopine dehydrogenase-like NADP-dependent oxidoreductase
MKKVIVLGAGMVGRAMAIDLSTNYEVYSADINEDNLYKLASYNIQAMQADLSDANIIKQIVADKELVIGAVPGFMGFQTLKTVIECGKNVCDISFFNEDPFLLDDLAKQNNVIAVIDCGVAPGMDNIILGYHNKKMRVGEFVCMVGGLPQQRMWPYEYKAPFSPIDVIEEYVRPARFVKDGKIVIKPALSEPELIDFEGVGTLEAFNSDGLRSLIKTMSHIPNMIERTLRFPGHIELMRVLRETGFFNKESIHISGVKVSPLDVTAKLLFPKWKLGDEEPEFTIMRVIVKGNEQGKLVTYIYSLLDKYNVDTKTSSMARTTGYTCTAAAELILQSKFIRKGINPPEFLAEDENNFRLIFKYLEEREIIYRMTKIEG